jgi:hypothetical protein
LIELIVASARSGDIAAVRNLQRTLDTDVGSRFLLEAHEIFISFLNPSLVPCVSGIIQGEIAAIYPAERGLHSLIGLQRVLQDVHSSPRTWVTQHKATAIATVAQKLKGIIAWFGFSLEARSLCHPRLSEPSRIVYLELFCRFLVAVRDLSSTLEKAVWEHTGVHDLVVTVWLTRNGEIDSSHLPGLDDDSKDYFLNWKNGQESGTILQWNVPAIMAKALRRDTVRTLILDKLYSQLQSEAAAD